MSSLMNPCDEPRSGNVTMASLGTFTEDKVFNDCVHGHIKLHPLCVKIIDTVEFQRLRNIKQVGPVYFVYPGASHNRFEHSLGVCYLAGQMVEALRRNCNNPRIISEDEKLCLEIAGLCHDLGHGPFSHTWERFIKAVRKKESLPNGNSEIKNWKHEDGSVKMFEYLLTKNDLFQEVIKSLGEMGVQGIEFIKELIRGEGIVRKDKKYLYQIISNKQNGIDVDRWDYFHRDGLQLNIKFTFNYHRLLEFCRVIEVSGEKIICFRNKEAPNIYDMFLVRGQLHHKAYRHHIVECIEDMMTDAFIEADSKGYKIKGPNGKLVRLSEAHNDVETLSCLTDHVLYSILYSVEDDFKQARALLQRIFERKLYKIVGWKNFSPEMAVATQSVSNGNEIDGTVEEEMRKYKKRLKENIQEICKTKKLCRFESFEVHMIKLDMGLEMHGALGGTSKKINPFSKIYFYDKRDVNKAQELEWNEIPIFPIPEESIRRIEGLIIFKDPQRVGEMDVELLNELNDFKAELKKRLEM